MATINLVFNADTAAAPAGFDNAIQAAANLLDAAITSPVNITIDIGYNETGGQTIPAGAAATASFYGDELPYAEVYNALVQHAASDEQKSILANIPSTPPTPAYGSIRVSQAQEQALGLPVGTGGQSPSGGPAGVDGIAGFGSGGGVFTWYTGTDFNLASATTPMAIDLETAAEHELSHALGRIVGPNPGAPTTIENLTDYSAPRVLASDVTSTGNYFSIDGGQTKIEKYDAYNVAQNSGDPADWAQGTGGAFNTVVTNEALQPQDLDILNALGFETAGALLPLTITDITTNPLATPDNKTATPFTSVTVNDPNAAPATDTITITLGAAAGTPVGTITDPSGNGTFDAGTDQFIETVPVGQATAVFTPATGLHARNGDCAFYNHGANFGE